MAIPARRAKFHVGCCCVTSNKGVQCLVCIDTVLCFLSSFPLFRIDSFLWFPREKEANHIAHPKVCLVWRAVRMTHVGVNNGGAVTPTLMRFFSGVKLHAIACGPGMDLCPNSLTSRFIIDGFTAAAVCRGKTLSLRTAQGCSFKIPHVRVFSFGQHRARRSHRRGVCAWEIKIT